MSFEKINWGTLLVVIPLGHLVVVSLYLWCWYVGFGAHATILADARDTFSLSISEMIPIYLMGFLLPTALTGFRYTRKYPTAQARLADITDPDKHASQSRHDATMRMIIVVGCVMIALQGLFGIFDLFMRGLPTTGVVTAAVYFIGFLTLTVIWRGAFLTNFQWETLLLVAALVFSATSNGLGAGQLARHRTFEGAEPHFFRCGETVVIRRLGDHLVGIAPNDEKVVTDLECKVVMHIPPHREEHRRVFRRQFPFVHYDPIATEKAGQRAPVEPQITHPTEKQG